MKPVVFASVKPLENAENLKAVYDAWDGPKVFIRTDGMRSHPEIRSGKYDLMVIDEYPNDTPGKAIVIWHAVMGGKTMGLDQPVPYIRKESANKITFAVVSGTGAVKIVAKCSNLPEGRVLPLGTPRTDVYTWKRKGDGQTPLAKKRSYLYVPTFRCREDPPYPVIDWGWLDNRLTDDEMLIIKAHRVTGNFVMNEYRHIFQVSPSAPTSQYLYDCDVAITDYSSVMFDAMLLGKPVVLFEKNKGYTETRGMYLKYPEEYSSRYCTDEAGLLEHLRSADGLGDAEKKFLQTMANACDGHSVERVCELIRQLADT